MAKKLAGDNIVLAEGYSKFLTHGMIHMDKEIIYGMINAHSMSFPLEQLRDDILAGPNDPVSAERLTAQGPVEQCYNILRIV